MLAETFPKGLSAEEFVAWAVQQDSGRYELSGGEVIAMSPERTGHVRMKFKIAQRLSEAIAEAKLPCEAFIDGLAVRVDADTVYEPDVLVRCGEPLDDNQVIVTDPLIVVEVVSRSSRGVDTGPRMIDYLRMPSVRHYLLVWTDRKTLVHYAKNEAGDTTTRIVTHFPVRLDPPGLVLQNVFED